MYLSATMIVLFERKFLVILRHLPHQALYLQHPTPRRLEVWWRNFLRSKTKRRSSTRPRMLCLISRKDRRMSAVRSLHPLNFIVWNIRKIIIRKIIIRKIIILKIIIRKMTKIPCPKKINISLVLITVIKSGIFFSKLIRQNPIKQALK